MRIKSLKVGNRAEEWDIDTIHFDSNLALLVGVSGAGKTQILRAINSLKDIINGASINGFYWHISFTVLSGKEFIWEGEFENISQRAEDENENSLVIISERVNNTNEGLNKNLIERTKNEIFFKGNKMPKLAGNESMIHILKEEQVLKEIYSGFNMIVFKDNANKQERKLVQFNSKEFAELKKTVKFTGLKNHDRYIFYELWASEQFGVYKTIKDKFLDIFPQVEELYFGLRKNKYLCMGASMEISIKEKNVEKRIPESRMSSGMLRILDHIIELYNSPDGTIFLIDELENNLGINCIDVLIEDLVSENQNIQFIATSHHPYIINNIPYAHWKVVSRKGRTIKVNNTTGYKLEKSKQDVFVQLTKILEKES